MAPTEIIGFMAASLTTLSFVPQAYLVIRTRRTAGISLLMYSFFMVGVSLWLTYGILTGAKPIIASNSVTVVLAGTILFIAASERFKRRGTLKARKPGVVLKPFQNPDIIYYQANPGATPVKQTE
jgi:MtN3 and saliva related transmembrane protein